MKPMAAGMRFIQGSDSKLSTIYTSLISGLLGVAVKWVVASMPLVMKSFHISLMMELNHPVPW
jgi:hypothetical protein